MKYLDLGKNEKVSCIGIGCMRIAGMNGEAGRARRFLASCWRRSPG